MNKINLRLSEAHQKELDRPNADLEMGIQDVLGDCKFSTKFVLGKVAEYLPISEDILNSGNYLIKYYKGDIFIIPK